MNDQNANDAAANAIIRMASDGWRIHIDQEDGTYYATAGTPDHDRWPTLYEEGPSKLVAVERLYARWQEVTSSESTDADPTQCSSHEKG